MVRFSFGTPVANENFFNREEEISYLEKRLFALKSGSRNDIAVVGPRRVGKSSLILQMAQHARKNGFKVVFLDCEGLDAESFTKEYGNALMAAELEGRTDLKVMEALRGSAGGAIAALSEILGGIKALELSPALGEFLKLRIEFEKGLFAGRGQKETVQELLESTLAFPSKSDSRYVIIFDEFPETARYRLESFHALFRRIVQYQKNAVYVYAGSSIGMMEEIFGNRRNPLAGNADIMDVKPFSERISKAFLTDGLKSYGKRINEDALQVFWERTNGFPAYLNWAGLRSLDLAGKTIRKEDAEKVAQEMASPMSPVYQLVEKQLSKLGRTSRMVLKSIAEGNDTPRRIGETAPARNVYVYLERLRKYGLIAKVDDGYQIIDPVIRGSVLKY